MDGRQHSRVFTFLRRQTHRVADTSAQGWRRVRLSLIWTAEVVFFPLYQLGRLTGKLLQSKSMHQFAPASVDRQDAIERVLTIVARESNHPIEIPAAPPPQEDWSQIDEADDLWNPIYAPPTVKINPAIPSPAPPALLPSNTIRGIASILPDRRLALISIDNQIIDLLTPAQQQKLERTIPLLAPAPTKTVRALPVARKQPPPPWWYHVTHRPVSPNPGLISGQLTVTAPTPSQRNFEDCELPQPDGLMLTVSTIKNPDLTIAPQPDGVLAKVRRLWDFYREYLWIDTNPGKIDRSSSGQNTTHAPDWIETEAEDLGYDRSWLVRLLLWLDRLMLKVENWAISVWRKIFHG
jgi:hypothetical protein